MPSTIKLHRGDTVVFSATPIPGNERAVGETIDRLYHIGCDVITPREAPIHASGHGYTEELKLMLNLLGPRYVMPAHGESEMSLWLIVVLLTKPALMPAVPR